MYCDIVTEFYSHHEPVASKRHRCDECNAPILKGEKHFQYTGKWEGELSSGRQHLLCMEACMLIRDHLEGECIPFGWLKEWWGEMKIECDRDNEHWQKLRGLLARIQWREHSQREMK